MVCKKPEFLPLGHPAPIICQLYETTRSVHEITSSCWFGITTLKFGLAADMVVDEGIFDASSILSLIFGGIGEGPGEGDPPSPGDDEFG